MSIAHWPQDERPREKLCRVGAQGLSDAELLAILLRTGVRGKSAVDMARDLLKLYGSLSAIVYASQAALLEMHGLGPAKVAQLCAIVELARRVLHEPLRETNILDSPESVHAYLRMTLGWREQEVFMVLFLSARNHVLAVEEISQGTLTQTTVYPREVARLALNHCAAAVILAHNHPSGEARPSQEDRDLTVRLVAALALVDVRVVDHVVVTRHQVSSFAQLGWL